MSKQTPKRETSAVVTSRPKRELVSLDDLATEADVCRRFLELEINRGRLVAVRLSPRVLRVRRRDWDAYLERAATAQPAA